MPDIYVRSTDGNDADDGSTWALAKATLAGAAAIDAAGDTIYVSQAHSESTAAAVTLNFAGTVSSPTRIICVNDANQPPTAVSTTGTIATTGTSNLAINGNIYVYGMAFDCGTGAGNPALSMSGYQLYKDSIFRILAGTGANIGVTGADETRVLWENVNISFSHSTQGFSLSQAGIFEWKGGSILAGSTAQTVLFRILGALNRGAIVEVSGVDLSNVGSAANLVTNTPQGAYSVTFRNCRLPSGWTGSLVNGTFSDTSTRVAMFNCDNGDTNYRLWVETLAGKIVDETTVVRAGGAVDGTTRLAWKVVSNANSNYPLVTLDTPEIVRWNDTVGTPITVAVEVLTDNVTLTNEQCWLEVQFLGTSGFPISSFVSDAKVDVLATAANQDTSTATWVTTGITTPVRQKLSVTFTPQEKGFIHAVVKLARPSTTVYVDPKITVS